FPPVDAPTVNRRGPVSDLFADGFDLDAEGIPRQDLEEDHGPVLGQEATAAVEDQVLGPLGVDLDQPHRTSGAAIRAETVARRDLDGDDGLMPPPDLSVER